MTGEAGAVSAAGDQPVTVDALVTDLAALGVRPGSALLVHTSLSALGWVAGGAAAVVDALLEALGPTGTLVVPTQTGDLSDPASWQSPPVPEPWWPQIRSSMAPYRPDATLPRAMGTVPLAVLLRDNALRSAHPQVSFAAIGPLAAAILANHTVEVALGDGSPLGRLVEHDGDVLLLGVGHAANTALHLAEHRASWPGKRSTAQGAPMLVDGMPRWVTWSGLEYGSDDFEQVGEELAAAGLVAAGAVGSGVGRLMRLGAIVAHATTWMSERRA